MLLSLPAAIVRTSVITSSSRPTGTTSGSLGMEWDASGPPISGLVPIRLCAIRMGMVSKMGSSSGLACPRSPATRMGSMP